jgi:hypothetical protein
VAGRGIVIVGIRRQGEADVRFIQWNADSPIDAGCEIQADGGELARVVIGSNQLHGAPPPGENCTRFAPNVPKELEPLVESVEAIRYDSMLSDYPGLGDEVTTPDGEGFVVSRNLRDRTYGVRLHSG